MKRLTKTYEMHIDELYISEGEMNIHTIERTTMNIWVGEEYGLRPELKLKTPIVELSTMNGGCAFGITDLSIDHDKTIMGQFDTSVRIEDGRNTIYVMRGKFYDGLGDVNLRIIEEHGVSKRALLTVDWRD
jgi:hypothetical protein